MKKIIGITGGIASGKSTVARMFAERGMQHFDADEVVHRLMREDKEMIAAIAQLFPQSLENGAISRRALSSIVAENKDALSVLESIIHPRVRAEEKRIIAQAGGGVILDVPLLFETGADAQCDATIAVHAPFALARERAFARPGMTQEKWQRLTHRQMDEQERCARANHVIPTDGTLAETRRHVDALMDKWGL